MLARERKFTKEELYQTTKQLLLEYGYEGYTFTLLANQLEVSRAAIYKYYDNKDELLSEYMLYELQTYLEQLEKIGEGGSFSKQFDALFDVIFNDMSLYQIRTMGMQIPTSNEKIATNKNKMNEIHTKLYTSLHAFIELGKQEKIVRNDLPNNLILGLIFQTVNIPNTENIPHNQWVSKLKDMICHGIFTN